MTRIPPKRKFDPSVSKLERQLGAEIKAIARDGRGLEKVVAAWGEFMPKGMSPHFERITDQRVLIVRLASASHRFLAARALKAGVESKILAAGGLKGIKLEVGK